MAVSASSYCRQNGNNEDVSYLHNEKFFITLMEKETISGRFNFFIYIKQKIFRSKNTNNVKAMLWSFIKRWIWTSNRTLEYYFVVGMWEAMQRKWTVFQIAFTFLGGQHIVTSYIQNFWRKSKYFYFSFLLIIQIKVSGTLSTEKRLEKKQVWDFTVTLIRKSPNTFSLNLVLSRFL